MADPVLRLSGIAKSFRLPRTARPTIRDHVFQAFRRQAYEELKVLQGVDLTVERGETLAVVGRNGSGKSTLLKIASGIFPADSGRVERFAELTAILELGLGWNPELTAVDNILLIGTLMGLSLKQAKASIDEVLAFAGVEAFANLELKHFSSGMASRLAYAIAFNTVREVLILDEIFAVGDIGFRTRCEERYRQLAKAGHTLILVSHDARVVSAFCQRAVLLDGGRIVHDGPAAEIAEIYRQTSIEHHQAGPSGAA